MLQVNTEINKFPKGVFNELAIWWVGGRGRIVSKEILGNLTSSLIEFYLCILSSPTMGSREQPKG